MPKVCGVVEEVNEEDEQLRKEFEELGEAIKDKITEKNRPLLIKKLNHLRARRRMSEKLSQSVVGESSRERATSKRGRGKKGKSVKQEPSQPTVLDSELDAGDGADQLNETFSVSDAGADGISPEKRKKHTAVSGWDGFVASEGPYAVARKRATTKNKSSTQSSDKSQDEPSEGGSTSMVQNGVRVKSFYAASDLPADNDKPRRGRTRTADDLRGKTDTVKVSTESADSTSIQQASLPMRRKARASAVPFAAKLPSDSVQEASAGDSSSSVAVSVGNVKLSVPSVEGRGRTTSRGQQHQVGEPSKRLEDAEKQNVTSRIPKLARFPSPAVQQEREKSVAGLAASASAAVTAANVVPQVSAQVTDTASGRPAAGVAVKLFSENQSGTWSHVADSVTDGNGRARELFTSKHRSAGTYRLHFETGSYYHQRAMETVYPHVDVVFSVDPAKPMQIGLAVGPYGYSTLACIDSNH